MRRPRKPLNSGRFHTLVNGDKIEALQSELRQARITFALLRRLVLLDEAAGRMATAEDIAAMTISQSTITRLETALADRGVTVA